MSDSDECKIKIPEAPREILSSDLLRSRLEGVFISPCGTEGCLWEGFPEWPEEFPYDAFIDEDED